MVLHITSVTVLLICCCSHRLSFTEAFLIYIISYTRKDCIDFFACPMFSCSGFWEGAARFLSCYMTNFTTTFKLLFRVPATKILRRMWLLLNFYSTKNLFFCCFRQVKRKNYCFHCIVMKPKLILYKCLKFPQLKHCKYHPLAHSFHTPETPKIFGVTRLIVYTDCAVILGLYDEMKAVVDYFKIIWNIFSIS